MSLRDASQQGQPSPEKLVPYAFGLNLFRVCLGTNLWGWDSIEKTWLWLGLLPGQIPFLPHFPHFAGWDVHVLFSIARRIFPSVHFHLSFCLFMCSGKVSPYLEHALNLHREPGAGGEGSVVLLQLQPSQREVRCLFHYFYGWMGCRTA